MGRAHYARMGPLTVCRRVYVESRMQTKPYFDFSHLPSLAAYLLTCAQESEYPSQEVAGQLFQIDYLAHARVRSGFPQALETDDIPTKLTDSWLLLAYARTAGCHALIEHVLDSATELGILERDDAEFFTASETEVLTDPDQVLVLQELVKQIATIHGEIAGALERTLPWGDAGSRSPEQLFTIQAAMRGQRELLDLLGNVLSNSRNRPEVNISSRATNSTILVSNAIAEFLWEKLGEDEFLEVATLGALRHEEEQAGWGTFHGVLCLTTNAVRFFYNPYHHENLWDLPEEFAWSLTEVLRFVRSPDRVDFVNDLKIKVGHVLEMLIESERKLNPRVVRFTIPEDRLKEFTKYRSRR